MDLNVTTYRSREQFQRKLFTSRPVGFPGTVASVFSILIKGPVYIREKSQYGPGFNFNSVMHTIAE